ncbi:divergent PAP2 family protein [Candidatus Aerophobetes bacterium]|nr:divergent PAP2 family protein [Candidatus Aerophobetes bacterium]
MIKVIYLFLKQRILLAIICAYVIAQGIKIIIPIIKERKIKLHRFIEPGGMPSSHSAVAMALLTGVGIKEGIRSTFFIITLIFALVTIYEAIGVRRAVGEQAELLNEILSHLSYKKSIKPRLKEKLGHTPLEVITGGIIGCIIALLWMS